MDATLLLVVADSERSRWQYLCVSSLRRVADRHQGVSHDRYCVAVTSGHIFSISHRHSYYCYYYSFVTQMGASHTERVQYIEHMQTRKKNFTNIQDVENCRILLKMQPE